jgi:hypothetical protein
MTCFVWDPGRQQRRRRGSGRCRHLAVQDGSNASENIQINPNGGRAAFIRDVAAINMDLNDVETITYNAFGGADNIVLSDMTGTDVTRVNANLAASGWRQRHIRRPRHRQRHRRCRRHHRLRHGPLR